MSSTAQIVPKEKIAANGDYNLSGERYREGVVSNTSYPLVPVSRFMKEGVKTVDPRTAPDEMFELWSIPAFDAGSPELVRGGEIGSQKKVVSPGDVLLSRIIPHIRRGWVVRENSDGRRQIASTEWIVFSSTEVVPGFLRQLLVSDFFHVSFMQTITGVGGSLSRANPGAVGEIKIPLPPLEVQKEIVAEIEGYQKVINGARAVLDHYRPHIPIHPDWPMTRLSEVIELSSGNFLTAEMRIDGPFPVYGGNGVNGHHSEYMFEKPTVVIGRVGAYCGAVHLTESKSWVTDNALYIKNVLRPVDLRFLEISLRSLNLNQFAKVGGQPSISQSTVYERTIPLPPLATQQAIVAEIEAEQALVAANRELITRFEQKIQATLARIWGEAAPA